MSLSVDLNADMGEGFGAWRMGDDQGLIEIVTSANVACGFHAGDPDQMARCMELAHDRGVGIGAHPGFLDLQGFGRRRMQVATPTLQNWIRYQLGAAQAMARSVDGNVRHFKLHGALSNMASEDKDLARAAFDAALSVDPELILVVLAATAQEAAARELGAYWAGEIFADRAYEDDATLVDRGKPGAVIHDAARATDRILAMVREGAIIAESGKRIPTRIDTICLHGDSPSAVTLAGEVRRGLEAQGVDLRPFPART